jgi:hypothetical protein
MTREELIEGYAAFLHGYGWSIFGTLTFDSRPPSSVANNIFRRWIDEVDEGCPSVNLPWRSIYKKATGDLRWVRVTETGKFGDHLHYHVLLGGLRNSSKYPLVLLWEDLAGDAVLSYYKPQQHGIRYMLKTVEPGRDFKIDFQLPAGFK